MDVWQAAGFYVGLNLLIILVLGYNVVRLRLARKIGIGDGGDERLQRAIRAHGNASEWTPVALIGLVLAAHMDAPVLAIHILGVALTLGRALHGVGLSGSSGLSLGRQIGMILTILTYLLLIIGLIGHAIT